MKDKPCIPESPEVARMTVKQEELMGGVAALLHEFMRTLITGEFKPEDVIKNGKLENGKDKNLYAFNVMNKSDKWTGRLQLAFVFEEKSKIL